jgi:excisionase family DNA binding protein
MIQELALDVHGERLLRPAEAARLWSVSEESLRVWVRKGLLDAVMTPGGHMRFRPSALADAMRIKAL